VTRPDTRRIDLGTSEDDVGARALYESAGFTNREGGPDGPTMLYYERELSEGGLDRKCVGLVEDEEEATLGIFAARRHRALHSPESLRDLHQIADSERAVGQPDLRRSVAEEHHLVERHLTSSWVEEDFGLVGSYTSF
jgi:hypothetical protein